MSLRRTPAGLGSVAILCALAAVFALELGTGAVGNDARLLKLGALPDTGQLGQDYWRLVTFGFLHSSPTHLLLNTVLLLLTGYAVERRVGPGWLLLIFLAASTASGVGIIVKHQAWPSSGVSVGASGGMFGLLGAALVLVFRLPVQRRWVRPGLILVLVSGLAYSLLPGISMTGHLTGLAVGAAIAALIPLKASPEPAGG